MCSLTRLVESSSSSSAGAQLSSRLSSLRVTLATKLPPRVLLPTLTKCYSSMVLDRQVDIDNGKIYIINYVLVFISMNYYVVLFICVNNNY